MALIVCLFFGGFTSQSRMFHPHEYVTITGEGLQIMTNTRHSWSLNSAGSLACHNFCDTGHPFIMVISEDPWHSHLLPSAWHRSCHYHILTTLVCRDRGSNPDFPHARRTLYHWATAAAPVVLKKMEIRKVYNNNNDNDDNGHILIRKDHLSIRFRWNKIYLQFIIKTELM